MLINKLSSLLRSEEGASAVEYGLIVGLIAVAVITVLILMGDNLNLLFDNTASALSDAAGGGAAP